MTRGLARLAAILAVLGGPAQAEGPPRRVMSLNLCADQLVLALLPPERIASVTWLARDPGESVMAAAARKVAVNRGQAEEAIRDRPDLVIAGAYSTPATRALLKRLGFRVLEIASPDSFQGVRSVTRQVAAAVGEPARGEALIARMDARLADLAREAGPPLRVAAWDGAGFSARPGSLYDAILRAAGARNVAAEARVSGASSPDVETLLATNPTLLIRTDRRTEAPALRDDAAYHPIVRRLWRGRTLVLPQAAYLCGTPFSADAAVRLRDDLKRVAGAKG